MIRKLIMHGAALMAVATMIYAAPAATATPAPAGFLRYHRWWQYDEDTWSHTWRKHPKLQNRFEDWKEKHPEATTGERKDFVGTLQDRHLDLHFNRSSGVQHGEASWFSDKAGACGKPLKGMYAASRTLPCGTVVSVRSGGSYVFVTILDRGPFTGNNRILDLSKAAFKELAPLSRGVVPVDAYRIAGT